MHDGKRLIRSAALGIADGIAVTALRPDWAQLAQDVAAPHRWLDRVGADQAALVLALAALWCVAVWLAVGLVAIAATALPGRAGGLARRIARRVLPAVVLRVVAGVAGLGVLVAPVAPAVAGAATPPSGNPAAARLAPAPAWPTDSSGPHIGWPTTPNASPPADPNASWPTTPGPTPPHTTLPPHATPPHPAPARPAPPHAGPPSSPATPTTERPTAPRTGADQRVRVRPGDSLWLIAAQRLGPDASAADVAAEWPRWYAANRAVIGDDPSLIEPGQVLHAPPTTG